MKDQHDEGAKEFKASVSGMLAALNDTKNCDRSQLVSIIDEITCDDVLCDDGPDGCEMRSIEEIENRIDERIECIKKLKDNMASNLFLHIDEVKKQISALEEIEHLCWVLNRPVPPHVHDYIK